jgi:SAM-dependent methyltransferase
VIAQRTFESYDDYVYKQGGKARGCREKLLKHIDRHIRSYERTFSDAATSLKPGPVLCLGARTGAESLGAEKAGFAGSVGIDLHPVGPTVIHADWHDLPFPAASFANAYSNSLDHCLYLDRLTAQVTRVLMPGGRFYVMATNRDDHTVEKWRAETKHNEALFWQTSDDLCEAIRCFGFDLLKTWRTGKWGHYVLAVKQ